MPGDPPVTSGGTVLTPAVEAALAAEAERGYDPKQLRPVGVPVSAMDDVRLVDAFGLATSATTYREALRAELLRRLGERPVVRECCTECPDEHA